MKLEDFIDDLYKAGWQAVGDAQHANIEKLWRELFPCVAQLSDELQEAEGELEQIRINVDC